MLSSIRRAQLASVDETKADDRVEMVPLQAVTNGNGHGHANGNGSTVHVVPVVEDRGPALPLTGLPEKILLEIAGRCIPVDVWALSQTCKILRTLVKSHEDLWTRSMLALCHAAHIPPASFASPEASSGDLANAAKRSVRFTSVISGDASSAWSARSLQPSTSTPVLGAALIPGGRWLVTRSRDELQCWDLGAGPLPAAPAAVLDLNRGEKIDPGKTRDVPGLTQTLLQLDQTGDGNTRIHVPHILNGVINFQVVLCDVLSAVPAFTILNSVQGGEAPRAPIAYSFRDKLVAGEYETAMTVWNWEEDKWITFTEDNFFDQPASPLHTSVQLHLVPPYLLAVWGGEAKLFEIPPLRPRRPKTKPAFVTIPSLWSVGLPHAINANPRVGRVFADAQHASRPLHLALVYDSEVLLYHLPPAAPHSKAAASPVLLSRHNLDAGKPAPASVAGGAFGQLAYTLLPTGDSVSVLHSRNGHNVFRALCTLPEAVGPGAEISVCPVSGRVVLLDAGRGKVSILDMAGK